MNVQKSLARLAVAALCLYSNNTFAQYIKNKTSTTINNQVQIPEEGLTVGNKVPDWWSDDVVNWHSNSVALSDFKNKLIIIDFWATWCGPCIAAMSNLESLQKKNSKILQIISVTTEDKSHVEAFMNKRKGDADIPIVTEDTVLIQLFKHRIIPHFIWIDQHLIVRGITSENEINQENIDKMIEDKTFTLLTKSDMLHFDQMKPLFIDGNGGDGSDFLARSILTKPITGLSGRIKIDIDGNRNISRIQAVNCSIIGLFNDAYSRMKYGGVNMTRICLNGAKALENNPINYDESWSKDKIFCYEFTMPKKIPDSVFFSYMLDDLNRYFEIKGKIVERTVNCWVLKRADKNIPVPLTHGGPPAFINGIFKNVSMQRITEELNFFTKIEPVIDETGINVNVDMTLDIEFNWNVYPNISELQKKLSKYGISMTKGKHNYKILEIEDKH